MLVPVTDSRGLSHSELFSCSQEGLPCLIAVSVLGGSHISARFIFAKATFALCTLDLKAPDLRWTLGFSEILFHVVFNFLDSFIKWFADCSHCNQEGPFPTKITCLVSMMWSHLQ